MVVVNWIRPNSLPDLANRPLCCQPFLGDGVESLVGDFVMLVFGELLEV